MTIYLLLLILAFPTAATAQQPPPPSVAAQTPASDPSTYYTFSYLNTTAIVIFAVLMLTFFFAGFITVCIRHCSADRTIPRYSFSASTGRPRWLSPSGLDRAAVDSFPILNYSEIKHLRIGKGVLSCAVCVSEFEDNAKLRLLPKCDHVFHPECIDPWLASHSTCPLCRADLSQRIQSMEDCNSAAEIGEVRNQCQISVTVDGNQGTDTGLRERTMMFPRSHSTGHSLVRLGEDCERYTLSLPEGVMRQVERLDRGGTSDWWVSSRTGFLWSAKVGVVHGEVTAVEASKVFPRSPFECLDGKSERMPTRLPV